MTIRILVDADACPVKDEVFRVAERHAVRVTLVSNSGFRVPRNALFESIVVEQDPDAADDVIADAADPLSIVITADIPLADRCLKAGAVVLRPNGTAFTTHSIGSEMAMRSLMQDLRAGGDIVGGPRPFEKRDRSNFLQALDREVVRLQRAS